MIEPNKVYRSGCLSSQEASSYGGTSFSSNFKNTMDSFGKGSKIRNFLQILIFIFGFLIIAVLFTLLGLYLYPKLVRVCKKEIYSDLHLTEKEMRDSYLPSLSEILNGMGMCKESLNDTLTERVQRNITKTESFFENVGNNSVQNNKCKCLNLSMKANTLENDSKKENETSDTESELDHQCICYTESDDDFETNKTTNQSENFVIKLYNVNKEIHLKDYHNKTYEGNGTNYLQSDVCDCKNTSKMNNISVNGAEDYITYENGNKCNCSKIATDANRTEYVSKENDSNFLKINKCNCLNLDKGKNGILNGSEFEGNVADVNFSKGDKCVCPEESETSDFINSKTTNVSQKHIMESLNIGEVNDVSNFPFNETQTLNGSLHLMKEKCICPSTPNITDIILNRTNPNSEVLNGEFDENGVCKCPKLLGNVGFNINETILESETNNASSLLSEECLCLDVNQMTANESVTDRNKIGFKTVTGKCVCSETHGVLHFNTSEKLNVSNTHAMESPGYSEIFQRENFNLTEAKAENENQSLKSDKCICPKSHDMTDEASNETNDVKFKEDDNCKCPGPEILEIDNFDLHETKSGNDQSEVDSLKSHECICPEMPEALGNGSVFEKNKLGFKTEDGKCVCPEILEYSDVHSKVTESINAETMPYDNEKETKKEQKKDYRKETTRYMDLENSYEKETLSAKELTDDNEKITVKKQKNTRKKKV